MMKKDLWIEIVLLILVFVMLSIVVVGEYTPGPYAGTGCEDAAQCEDLEWECMGIPSCTNNLCTYTFSPLTSPSASATGCSDGAGSCMDENTVLGIDSYCEKYPSYNANMLPGYDGEWCIEKGEYDYDYDSYIELNKDAGPNPDHLYCNLSDNRIPRFYPRMDCYGETLQFVDVPDGACVIDVDEEATILGTECISINPDIYGVPCVSPRFGIWAFVSCKDNEASDISGFDFYKVYFQGPISRDEIPQGDFAAQMGAITGLATTIEWEDPYTAAILCITIAIVNSVSNINAENQATKNMYISNINTLLDTARDDIRDNNYYCRCEGGEFKYELKIIYPAATWQFHAEIGVIVGTLVGGILAIAEQDASVCIIAGEIIATAIDSSLASCPLYVAPLVPGYSQVPPLSADNITTQTGGVDVSLFNGLISQFISDLIPVSFEDGVMKANLDVPDDEVDYDRGGAKDDMACSILQCGRGVVDEDLSVGEKCCGDDSTDDPDLSLKFCEGGQIITGTGSGTLDASCRLGNAGYYVGMRDYVGEVGAGECCGDDSGLIPGGAAQPTDDIVKDDCAQLFQSTAGANLNYLCWLNKEYTTAQWLDPLRPTGFVYYLPCADIEVVATGRDFMACGEGGAYDDSTVNGKHFDSGTAEERIISSNEFDVPTVSPYLQYFCYDETRGSRSIAYCAPEELSSLIGGDYEIDEKMIGGKQIKPGGTNGKNDFAVFYELEDHLPKQPGYATYYCAHYIQGDNEYWNFTTDLDDLDERGDPKGETCDADYSAVYLDAGKNYQLKLRWTGDFCCGEDDDRNKGKGESYNEIAGENEGACFRNYYQANDGGKARKDGITIKKDGFMYYPLYNSIKDNSYEQALKANEAMINVSHKWTEAYIFNGSFQTCAVKDSYVKGEDERFKFPRNPTPYQGSLNGSGATITSNDFLLDEKDHPNPGNPADLDSGEKDNTNGTVHWDLMRDHKYCDFIGKMDNDGEMENDYFCSYTEQWLKMKEDGYKNRSYLSYIPRNTPLGSDSWMDEGLQLAECCEPGHPGEGEKSCWNGTSCVDSVHRLPEELPFRGPDNQEGWRCVQGEWVYSSIKYTWDNQFAGFCPNETQCLVDIAGNFDFNGMPEMYSFAGTDNPTCINNTQYIMDHYCDNGNWTTRTRMIALDMINKASGDYDMFCDRYDKVLNYLDYNPTGMFIPSELGMNIGDIYIAANQDNPYCLDHEYTPIDCGNNICVMADSQKVYLGISLNQNLSSARRYNLLELFEQEPDACNNALTSDEDRFIECTGTVSGKGTIYYNPKLKMLIFSKDSTDVMPEGTRNYAQMFFDMIFRDILGPMINAIINLPDRGPDYQFLTISQDANKMYYSTAGGKEIFGVMEKKYTNPVNIEIVGGTPGVLRSTLLIQYKGVNADICKSIEQAQAYIQGVECFSDAGGTRIVTFPRGTSDIMHERFWIDLTSRLRAGELNPDSTGTVG